VSRHEPLLQAMSMAQEPPRATSIAIQSIGMRYRTGDQELVALSGVSFDVKQSEFVSILGPSGCGKSTLLMIIAGLVPPTEGQVSMHGVPVTRPVTDLGIVFQQDLLFDWRTVLGNIMLQAEVRGLPKDAARAKARRLLQQVGLEQFENHRPWELSGGMRQRVAICRALLPGAATLLLDEPFGALDALTRDKINLDLLDIWALERPTTLLVTHSIAEAIFLSDRVVVMSPRPGRIVDDVTIDLPRPRTMEMRDTAHFADYQRRLRAAIGG
jgi:NitT/TauT family transport system ATP-binding protein